MTRIVCRVCRDTLNDNGDIVKEHDHGMCIECIQLVEGLARLEKSPAGAVQSLGELGLVRRDDFQSIVGLAFESGYKYLKTFFEV